MAREISLDESFEKTAESDSFYVDKTGFLREWYKSKKRVTLITRPRRFGKTLTMNMVERFFSTRYEKQPQPFLNLKVGQDKEMMELQGIVPVISLTFMSSEGRTYREMVQSLDSLIRRLFRKYRFLENDPNVHEDDVEFISYMGRRKKDTNGEYIAFDEEEICESLGRLSEILHDYYDKNVIILLDEYDTPLQSAYLNGYWQEAAGFFGKLFKMAFKENEYLDKALITGISRFAKESLFSPFNNPALCSVTAPFYEDCFGYTQEEVDHALAEFGMEDKREEVRLWYDGYQFGRKGGMYNPWSINNFLSTGETESYWTNTASNEIVSHVVRNGAGSLKDRFASLMQGETVTVRVAEDTTYNTLLAKDDTVWGLLLACGYLKSIKKDGKEYTLAIVNHEVMEMMDSLFISWFTTSDDIRPYDDFIEALVSCDEEKMQEKLSVLSMELIGIADGSSHEGKHEPEKFYHGFALGLVATLRERFVISSNIESGTGRSDILMEPRDKAADNGIILEFKVFKPGEDESLGDTCKRALDQIEKKKYAVELVKRGVPEERIVKFGIGYKGKEVLVRKG